MSLAMSVSFAVAVRLFGFSFDVQPYLDFGWSWHILTLVHRKTRRRRARRGTRNTYWKLSSSLSELVPLDWLPLDSKRGTCDRGLTEKNNKNSVKQAFNNSVIFFFPDGGPERDHLRLHRQRPEDGGQTHKGGSPFSSNELIFLDLNS